MNRRKNVSSTAGQMIAESKSHLQSATFTILHEYPNPRLELAWRDLLDRVELPSHYTSPEFFKEPYFEEKRPFAILVLRDQLAIAVLVGVHEGRTITCGLPTRPQIQIDPEHVSDATLDALMRGLEEESRGAELVSIYSWERTCLQRLDRYGYRISMLGGVPVLDLRQGAEAVLKGCDGKRRNCIRYAIKSGVEVALASTPEDYAAFYAIYRDWCTAKKMPYYSRELEESVFCNTQNNRRLFLARHSGVIIAGSVFRFFSGGLIEYSRNSSLSAYLSLKPNDILVWRAIEWACEQRFVSLSMGGGHRFLREFGGSTIPIVRYRLDRTFLRHHDRKEALIDSGRECLRRLPSSWATRLRRVLGKERHIGW